MNWLYTDMNSYFASVEQMARPELRQRPVAVVPLAAETTSVIAASVEAKRAGVRTGTRVREALQLCPGLQLVKARPDFYVAIHHQILKSVERCAPVCRVYSIDEWSVRLRGRDREVSQAIQLGRQIKQQLLRDFGPWLTCSIGIGPTRLLAKIASDLQKPDGLTVLSTEDLPGRLEHLQLQDLAGIGAGISARLARHGVRTIRDLWGISRETATRVWGSVQGASWWAGFHGEDEAEQETTRRTMTHGHVLAPQYRHDEGARGVLIRLINKLGQRLRTAGYCARSLQLSLRYLPEGRFQGEIGLSFTQDTTTLLQQFQKLWLQRPQDAGPILKVDVTVCGLVKAANVPRSLFDGVEKLKRVSHTIDKIHQQCGPGAIRFGPAQLPGLKLENKIAFGRIPEDCDPY
ncbi:Y-family DNA polymerase [Planctomicrobium sp. SH664]|uniref:Y-family DNA polymerase n=1 Tax=Planctomicrobium sp. SH664 TaxID=3448125 RepID=UPI003F5B0E4F